MSTKKKDKKVEEDMVMSVSPEGTGGTPSGLFPIPNNMDTFSLLGPGGTGKNPVKKKKKKKKKEEHYGKAPGMILTFDQFFKGRKKKNK